MKTWVMIDGVHINLATATVIQEIGPQGTEGYTINHGQSSVTIKADKENRKYQECVGVLTQIRFYLYNHKIPAVAACYSGENEEYMR